MTGTDSGNRISAGQLILVPAVVTLVITILRLYGPNGQIIATDDDGIEPTDALLIDQTLPVTGTYTIEVDTYSGPNVPHTATGDYELFMYSFARGADQGQGLGDSLVAGSGNDVLIGSSGSDTYVFKNGTGNFDDLPMDMPVGPEYVVGPGDTLNIEMWGGISQRAPIVTVSLLFTCQLSLMK